MQPENDIKDELDRTVDEEIELTSEERKILTMIRKLSDTDRRYVLRVTEVMLFVGAESRSD